MASASKEKLLFPDFDTIKVSTKTFIVRTNVTFDIGKLFDFLPTTNYIVIPKKRGRKKKSEKVDPNKGIPTGSIITLEYVDKLRGVDLKKKNKKSTEKKKRGNYFRNSVTVVMIIDDKKINFKVSRNGKFQMTGCKFDEHAEKCVGFIWKYVKDTEGIYEFEKEETKLKAIFVPAMRNIDFALNFKVDREKLDTYFNNETEHYSLLETSFGYTGVNIKFPLTKPITELDLKQLRWSKKGWKQIEDVNYKDYLLLLPEKERDKKLKKKRFNTFLVFHSGKVILSSLEASYSRDAYYEFLDIIRDCYDIIKEKLDT